MNINEQLQTINALRNDCIENPKKYNDYKKQRFVDSWGFKMNLSTDFKCGMERDALMGATNIEIKWYKDFLKLTYNAECWGSFEELEGSELHKELKTEKNTRARNCVMSGKMGNGAGVRELIRPDAFTSFSLEGNSKGIREGFDMFNHSINLFDKDEWEIDEMVFTQSTKKAIEHIANDVEFKINFCNHNRGFTLIQGLRRIFRLKRIERKMHNIRLPKTL